MIDQVNQLVGNKWINKCGRPWGRIIVLAISPHQENINNIEDFI